MTRRLRADLPPFEPSRLPTLLTGVVNSAADLGLLDVGYGAVESPFGRLLVAATPVGIIRVAFESEPEEQVLSELAGRVSSRVLRAPHLVDDARRQLSRYFDGKLIEFQLPVDWRLTGGFRREVLRVTAGTARPAPTATWRPSRAALARSARLATLSR